MSLHYSKRGDESWEYLAVRIYLFPNLAATEAQWEYLILILHIAVFQNATLTLILSCFISNIQVAFLIKLPYFEAGC